MNSDEQIAKILELEQALRDKPAKFTVQTLMPVGLVLTIIGFSFAFGVNFQAANQTKIDLDTFKKEYKEAQVELKADIKSIQSDIRVLLLGQQNAMDKK